MKFEAIIVWLKSKEWVKSPSGGKGSNKIGEEFERRWRIREYK